MTAYIIRRLWQMIPTLAGVVLLVFFLFNWVGGDPAYVLAGKISNQEQIDNIRRQLGVDQPVWVQLWIFIKQVLTYRLVIIISAVALSFSLPLHVALPHCVARFAPELSEAALSWARRTLAPF